MLLWISSPRGPDCSRCDGNQQNQQRCLSTPLLGITAACRRQNEEAALGRERGSAAPGNAPGVVTREVQVSGSPLTKAEERALGLLRTPALAGTEAARLSSGPSCPHSERRHRITLQWWRRQRALTPHACFPSSTTGAPACASGRDQNPISPAACISKSTFPTLPESSPFFSRPALPARGAASAPHSALPAALWRLPHLFASQTQSTYVQQKSRATLALRRTSGRPCYTSVQSHEMTLILLKIKGKMLMIGLQSLAGRGFSFPVWSHSRSPRLPWAGGPAGPGTGHSLSAAPPFLGELSGIDACTFISLKAASPPLSAPAVLLLHVFSRTFQLLTCGIRRYPFQPPQGDVTSMRFTPASPAG